MTSDAPAPNAPAILDVDLPEHVGEVLAEPGLPNSSQLVELLAPQQAQRTLHWGSSILYVTSPGEGGLDVVVKEFRFDSPGRRLDRRLRGDRARRSWLNSLALYRLGAPVPRPVAWLRSRQADGPSWFVSELVDGATEWRIVVRAINANGVAREFPGLDLDETLEQLGRTVRRLHDLGCWHRDLSIGNVLLGAGSRAGITIIDLDRARLGRPPSWNERMRDLARLALRRPEHRQRLLDGYLDGSSSTRSLASGLLAIDHHLYQARNVAKQRLRKGARAAARRLLPQRPPPPHLNRQDTTVRGIRDDVVWDPLTHQPYHRRSNLRRLTDRVRDLPSLLREAGVILASAPRILAAARRLDDGSEPHPAPLLGIGLDPATAPAADQAELVRQLGVRHALIRVHLWQELEPAQSLAGLLHAAGVELTFALAQNRELAIDREAWQARIKDVAERLAPFGRRFQIGQAINRSKWGFWNRARYLRRTREASSILRDRVPAVEILGPAVIDFEPHVLVSALNLPAGDLRFDAVSVLLYADRRGAPESPQLGFDLVGKSRLMKAVAISSRHACERVWVTEFNWPLREGAHSPAGRAVSVDEQTQADYLARYIWLLAGAGTAEAIFWWQMVATGYGLVDPRGGKLRRRPAWDALAEVERLLPQGSRVQRLSPLHPALRAVLVSRPPEGTTAVVWSRAEPIELFLPAAASVILDRGGRPFDTPSSGRLDVGPSPLSIQLPPDTGWPEIGLPG